MIKNLIWILAHVVAYVVAIFIAKMLTSWLGDWDNFILLGAIFHLYWIKEDKTL